MTSPVSANQESSHLDPIELTNQKEMQTLSSNAEYFLKDQRTQEAKKVYHQSFQKAANSNNLVLQSNVLLEYSQLLNGEEKLNVLLNSLFYLSTYLNDNQTLTSVELNETNLVNIEQAPKTKTSLLIEDLNRLFSEELLSKLVKKGSKTEHQMMIKTLFALLNTKQMLANDPITSSLKIEVLGLELAKLIDLYESSFNASSAITKSELIEYMEDLQELPFDDQNRFAIGTVINNIKESAKVIEQTPKQPEEDKVEETIDQPKEDKVEDRAEQPADEKIEETPKQPEQDKVEETIDQPKEDKVEETIDQPADEKIEETPNQPKEDKVEDTTKQPEEDKVEDKIDQPNEQPVAKPEEKTPEDTKEANKLSSETPTTKKPTQPKVDLPPLPNSALGKALIKFEEMLTQDNVNFKGLLEQIAIWNMKTMSKEDQILTTLKEAMVYLAYYESKATKNIFYLQIAEKSIVAIEELLDDKKLSPVFKKTVFHFIEKLKSSELLFSDLTKDDLSEKKRTLGLF